MEETPQPVPPTPKNFVLKCGNCSRSELTTGISTDLAHLHEYKSGCPTCGGPRKFRCMHCGGTMKMLRIRGNT